MLALIMIDKNLTLNYITYYLYFYKTWEFTEIVHMVSITWSSTQAYDVAIKQFDIRATNWEAAYLVLNQLSENETLEIWT